MRPFFDVLIVGSGHGGAQAAISLRQEKFDGTIGLISDEPEPPYERPPLSKDYLSGVKPFERLLIRPVGFWSERNITLLPGHRVVAVDAEAHEVTIADRSTIAYGRLIWATGGRPRQLSCSGHDLPGVHTVRTRADVDRMLIDLQSATRVVVVGGGYIGLETAASLVKLGKHVTVLEALDRVLARVAGPELSSFFEAEHRAHGVDLRLNATVAGLESSGAGVSGVRLASGELLQADMVVVGIGIVPSVEALLAIGAKGGNGVEVDGQCRTSLPDVFAIGDCARHSNIFADGEFVRLESVQNAVDQGTTVAKTLLNSGACYAAVPCFGHSNTTSNCKLSGSPLDAVAVRGSIEKRSFSVIYLKNGRVIALDCVNATKDYIQGRSLVVGRAYPDLFLLTDPDVPLKARIRPQTGETVDH